MCRKICATTRMKICTKICNKVYTKVYKKRKYADFLRVASPPSHAAFALLPKLLALPLKSFAFLAKLLVLSPAVLALLLIAALPCRPSSCHVQERVNLGLTGTFGYSGAVKCVEIYRSRSNLQIYAYCGTQEGLLIIDITDPASPRMAASFDLGQVRAITFYHPAGEDREFALLLVAGTGAGAGAGTAGGSMIILDLDHPGKPAFAGRYDLLMRPQRIVTLDHYACVADGSKGLVIIDLHDPAKPVYVSGYHTAGEAEDIALFGHYACLADGSNGLVIIDLSDPTEPVYVAGNPLDIRESFPHYDYTKNVSAIAIYGHYACLAIQSEGMAVVDLYGGSTPPANSDTPTNPTNPPDQATSAYQAASTTSANPAEPAAAPNPAPSTANYAASAATPNPAESADSPALFSPALSPTLSPSLLSWHKIDGEVNRIVICGHYAYVADGPSGLLIIDLSDPARPVDAGRSYVSQGWSGIGQGAADTTSDTGQGAANTPGQAWTGLGGFNPGQTEAMKAQDICGAGHAECGVQDIAISGSYACLAHLWGNGLTILTVQDPATPFDAGKYNTKGYAQAVAVSGSHAFIADEENGLLAIDISDPSKPALAGHYHTEGTANNLAVFGNYACVADENMGLSIIDLTTCLNKSAVLQAKTAKGPQDIKDIACSTTWPWALALDVEVSSHHAYIADKINGLMVFDLSGLPSPPALVGSSDAAEHAQNLAISGDYAYVACWSNGLVIIRITDPNQPVFAGRYSHQGLTARDVAVAGNYAYVAAGDQGLLVIEISDPENPKLIGQYVDPARAGGTAPGARVLEVTLSGHFAYLSTGEEGLIVLTLDDPVNPAIIGREDTKGVTSGVVVREGLAYVADAEAGLLIFRIIDTPTPQGNLILVPSGPASVANSLWPATQGLANLAYSAFLNQGIPRSSLYYFNPDPYQDLDGDGFPDPLVVNDSAPSPADLKYALTDWAVSRLSSGPLYLYLPGQGAGGAYQIMPGDMIRADETIGYDDDNDDDETMLAGDSIRTDEVIMAGDTIRTIGLNDTTDIGSLKTWLDSFQQKTGRDVICLMEFSSSGSFSACLMDANTAPYSRNIISCTDSGMSFLDPDGGLSFTGQFLKLLRDSGQTGLFSGSGLSLQKARGKLLQALFSEAREIFWSSGFPWNTQPPQMVSACGSHTLVSIGLMASVMDIDSGNSTSFGDAPVIITNADQRIMLKAIGHYLDGSQEDLSGRVYYQSSDPSILLINQQRQEGQEGHEAQEDQEGQEGQEERENGREFEAYVNPDASYNGPVSILATIIDPNFAQSPGHNAMIPPLGGITGRIPVKVDVSAGKQKESLPKAIIVAGRSNDPTGYDYLWESISQTANYAYNTFLERGYSPQNIFYLSHDLNQPGVDGSSPDKSFFQVLEEIFTSPAANPYLNLEGLTDLTVLLIDHGRKNAFLLGPAADQSISPALLDQWLDGIQKEYPYARITVIIDACFSGDFVNPLIQGHEQCQCTEQQRGAGKRTVIASTSEADAYLAADGWVSFTSFLFTHLRSGASLAEAFEQAHTDLAALSWGCIQHPVLRDTDNGQCALTTRLGGPFILSQDQPQIVQVSGLADPNRPILPHQPVDLWARVEDLDGVDSVWAFISNSQAGVQFSGSVQDPVMLADMVRVDLTYNPDHGRYEGTYEEGFPYGGPYTVLFLARDLKGLASYPRAIYLEIDGGNCAGQDYAFLVYDAGCPECAIQADSIQWILEKRRVPKENIIKLQGVAGFSSSLASFIANPPASLEHLLLAFISKGNLADLDGYGQEALTQQLDRIQQATGCTIISLIEADESGRFLPILKGPGRITISSTGTKAVRAGCGAHGLNCLLFSPFFFSGIYRGMDIYRAFQSACQAMGYYRTGYYGPGHYGAEFYDLDRGPLLDDNGNGLGSEYGQNYDGRTASSIYLGSPFEPVDEGPKIAIPSGVHLDAREGRSALIWARVQDPSSQVMALVTSPDGVIDQPVVLAYNPDTARFEAEYDGFGQQGSYRVGVSVQDRHGLTDFGQTYYLSLWPDGFEVDDNSNQAGALVVNQPSRRHSFHTSSDEDWIYFFGYAGLPYKVSAAQNWPDCPLRIEVYDPNGIRIDHSPHAVTFTTPENCTPENCSGDEEKDENGSETGNKDRDGKGNGFYKVRVSYTCPVLPAGDYPFYELSVSCPKAGTGGIWGWVRDADTGEGIIGARICTPSGQCTTSMGEWWSTDAASSIKHVEGGFYLMDTIPKSAGGLTITAKTKGYLPTSLFISGYDENLLNVTFYLKRDPATAYQPATDPAAAQMVAGVLQLQSPRIKVEVPLLEGLNLFSHPNADPRFPYDIWDFMVTYGQFDQAQGPCFSSVTHYNHALLEMCSFVYSSQGRVGQWSIECSNHFPMASGKGYAIYMKRNETLDFPIPMANPAIDLKKGQNWVGIPSPSSGYTAYMMLQDMGCAEDVASIRCFDPSSGRWKTAYWKQNRPAGDNFPIRSGQGYLVNMIRDKLGWLPGW
ncbi:MAG: hypothetical protein AB1847_20630 [bacterium]